MEALTHGKIPTGLNDVFRSMSMSAEKLIFLFQNLFKSVSATSTEIADTHFLLQLFNRLDLVDDNGTPDPELVYVITDAHDVILF